MSSIQPCSRASVICLGMISTAKIGNIGAELLGPVLWPSQTQLIGKETWKDLQDLSRCYKNKEDQ